MAAVESYKDNVQISAILRHCSRDIKNSSNEDINPSLSVRNRVMTPDRHMRDYDYYKKRLRNDVYKDPRPNVVTMSQWIVTAPKDLAPQDNEKFFNLVYDFLNDRYGGEENCIQAIIHYDEQNKRGHLHYSFMPVVRDDKHGREWKLCKWKVLTPTDLKTFHPDLQKFLDDHDCHCTVMSGVTKASGGNRTVKNMKREAKRQQTREQQQKKITEEKMLQTEKSLEQRDPDIERWNRIFEDWQRERHAQTEQQLETQREQVEEQRYDSNRVEQEQEQP